MPVSGKTRKDVLTEFRHQEILEAACQVFAERGFREATLDEIAGKAGLAKGTLYLYFSSKEEIFQSVMYSRLSELMARMRTAVSSGSTAAERIRNIIKARLEFFRSDEAFWRIYYTEFGQLCQQRHVKDERFRELFLQATQLVAPVLQEGMERGELRRMPPMAAAMALLDLLRNTMALYLMGMQKEEVDLEQFVFDLFWGGVAAPGGSQTAREIP